MHHCITYVCMCNLCILFEFALLSLFLCVGVRCCVAGWQLSLCSCPIWATVTRHSLLDCSTPSRLQPPADTKTCSTVCRNMPVNCTVSRDSNSVFLDTRDVWATSSVLWPLSLLDVGVNMGYWKQVLSHNISMSSPVLFLDIHRMFTLYTLMPLLSADGYYDTWPLEGRLTLQLVEENSCCRGEVLGRLNNNCKEGFRCPLLLLSYSQLEEQNIIFLSYADDLIKAFKVN